MTDFATKAQRSDDRGRPIWSVQLVASFKDDRSGKHRSEIVNVKVVGDAPALPLGSPVRVVELVAIPWVNNDRNGIAYRAAAIEPANRAATRAS